MTFLKAAKSAPGHVPLPENYSANYQTTARLVHVECVADAFAGKHKFNDGIAEQLFHGVTHRTSAKSRMITQVNGQLVRGGVFEDRPFTEAVPFKLSLKLQRNPNMVQNGRFPTAVNDFKYETLAH
jgi:hypothetical protein